MTRFPAKIPKDRSGEGALQSGRWSSLAVREEVFLPLLPPAHLDQGRVQVDVMGHDDGTDDAHSLQ
jgi:hypothetical protein